MPEKLKTYADRVLKGLPDDEMIVAIAWRTTDIVNMFDDHYRDTLGAIDSKYKREAANEVLDYMDTDRWENDTQDIPCQAIDELEDDLVHKYSDYGRWLAEEEGLVAPAGRT